MDMHEVEHIIKYDLRTMPRKTLDKLAAALNAELAQRNREAEHFAHLGRTSDDPGCSICRDAAARRSGA